MHVSRDVIADECITVFSSSQSQAVYDKNISVTVALQSSPCTLGAQPAPLVRGPPWARPTLVDISENYFQNTERRSWP